jgi:hypothetical protein
MCVAFCGGVSAIQALPIAEVCGYNAGRKTPLQRTLCALIGPEVAKVKILAR